MQALFSTLDIRIYGPDYLSREVWYSVLPARPNPLLDFLFAALPHGI